MTAQKNINLSSFFFITYHNPLPIILFYHLTNISQTICAKMEDMDEASQAEIFRLLLQDTEHISDASIDTQADSDLQLALSLWQEEVDKYVTISEDRRVAERVASAPRRDRGNRAAFRGRNDKQAIASWRRLAAEQEVDLLGNSRCDS